MYSGFNGINKSKSSEEQHSVRQHQQQQSIYFHPHQDDENFLLSPVDHVNFERIDGSVVSSETQPFWRDSNNNNGSNGELFVSNEFNNEIIIFIENIQDVQFNKRSVRTQYTRNLKGRRNHHGGKGLLNPLGSNITGDYDDDEDDHIYYVGGGAASFAEGSSTFFGAHHSMASSSRRRGRGSQRKPTKSVLKNSKQSIGSGRRRRRMKPGKRRTASIGDSRLRSDSDLRNALDVGETYYNNNGTTSSRRGGDSVASSVGSGSEHNPAWASVYSQQSTHVGDSVISELTDARSYYDRGPHHHHPSSMSAHHNHHDVQSVASQSSYASNNRHRSSPPLGGTYHQKAASLGHLQTSPPSVTSRSIYETSAAAAPAPAGSLLADTILERSERSEASFRPTTTSRYSPEKTRNKNGPKLYATGGVPGAPGETSNSTIDTHDLTVAASDAPTNASPTTMDGSNKSPTTTTLSSSDYFHVSGLEIEFHVNGEARKGWYTGMICRTPTGKEVPHDELAHLEFHNGDLYDGPFHYGYMQGSNATFQWKQGDLYRGDMYLNMRHGEGEYVTVHQRRYVGSYRKDVPHGHGILYNSDKTIFHLGQWYKGRPDEEDAASSHYNRSIASSSHANTSSNNNNKSSRKKSSKRSKNRKKKNTPDTEISIYATAVGVA